MLDSLPPELRPFVGVVVLAVLFVITAGAIHRYRTWQAEKMAKAQRLLRGARRIVQALERSADLALPRELVVLFNGELVARYRGVLELFPSYEGISERIREAEGQARAAGGSAGWEVPPIGEQEQLDDYTATLTGLVAFLQEERPAAPLDPKDARELRERLRTLRAEARYGFVTAAALSAAGAGEWQHAQEEMLQLLAFLKQKAPPNDRGKALYWEANGIYHQLQRRELPAGEQTGEAMEG